MHQTLLGVLGSIQMVLEWLNSTFFRVFSAFLCWDPDSPIHTGEMSTVKNDE
jgi:hypothetical protein